MLNRRKALFKTWPEVFFHISGDYAALFRRGEFSEYCSRTNSIAPVDTVDTWCKLVLCDLIKGDSAAIRCTDAKIIKAVERATCLWRVTNHHADVFAITRQTLHFKTVIGLTNLLGYHLEGNTQSLCSRLHRETKLVSRRRQIVTNVIGRVVSLELRLDHVYSFLKCFQIRVAECNTVSATATIHREVEADFFCIRNRAGRFTQSKCNVFCRQAFRTVFRQQGANEGLDTAFLGDDGSICDNVFFNFRESFCENLTCPIYTALKLIGNTLRTLKRCTIRHGDVCHDEIALDLWHHRSWDDVI